MLESDAFIWIFRVDEAENKSSHNKHNNKQKIRPN